VDTESESGLTLEPFRDGWVLVSAEGRIMTPEPMSDERAWTWARMTGIDFPGGPRTGHLRLIGDDGET
jgi:hypothetical protein